MLITAEFEDSALRLVFGQSGGGLFSCTKRHRARGDQTIPHSACRPQQGKIIFGEQSQSAFCGEAVAQVITSRNLMKPPLVGKRIHKLSR
jgi:hypothetical protein